MVRADAQAPTEVMEPADADAEAPDDPALGSPGAQPQSRLGIAAFVTGALGVWVAAIPLGHLGMNAARRGREETRSFAMAGTILGYLGLALTAVLVWFLVRGPQPETVDAYAHHDVVEVGNAVGAALAAQGDLPAVEVAGEGYAVGDASLAGALDTQRTVTLTEVGDDGWCLELDYVGGNAGSWSFDSAQGVTEGGTCAAA